VPISALVFATDEQRKRESYQSWNSDHASHTFNLTDAVAARPYCSE
jgi:hypothetical protein